MIFQKVQFQTVISNQYFQKWLYVMIALESFSALKPIQKSRPRKTVLSPFTSIQYYALHFKTVFLWSVIIKILQCWETFS